MKKTALQSGAGGISAYHAGRSMPGKSNSGFKQQERTISLELEFIKKSSSPLQRAITFLNWGPNAYATGFLVVVDW